MITVNNVQVSPEFEKHFCGEANMSYPPDKRNEMLAQSISKAAAQVLEIEKLSGGADATKLIELMTRAKTYLSDHTVEELKKQYQEAVPKELRPTVNDLHEKIMDSLNNNPAPETPQTQDRQLIYVGSMFKFISWYELNGWIPCYSAEQPDKLVWSLRNMRFIKVSTEDLWSAFACEQREPVVHLFSYPDSFSENVFISNAITMEEMIAFISWYELNGWMDVLNVNEKLFERTAEEKSTNQITPKRLWELYLELGRPAPVFHSEGTIPVVLDALGAVLKIGGTSTLSYQQISSCYLHSPCKIVEIPIQQVREKYYKWCYVKKYIVKS